MGQEALLNRCQVNHGEFEPLGRVQRHHRDAILLLVPAVEVAGQGDVLEPIAQGPAGILGRELARRRDEFLDVGQAFLVLCVRTVLEHAPIAAPFEDRADDLVGRGVGQFGEFIDEHGKVDQADGRLALDRRDLVHLARGGEHTQLARLSIST